MPRPLLTDSVARLEVMGGAEFIYEHFSSGDGYRSLAVLLDCSPGLAFRAVCKCLGDERERLMREAREAAAEIQTEMATEALTLAYMADPVRVAASLAQHRRWLASRWSQSFQPTAVTVGVRDRDSLRAVQVNIGQMHLHAAREAQRAITAGAEVAEVVAAEVESPEAA